MQLITTRNKEISFAELKKAISSGNGLELIRPDEIPSAAENAENLEEAICCFIDYGEYSVSGIMREVRAAYKEAEK